MLLLKDSASLTTAVNPSRVSDFFPHENSIFLRICIKFASTLYFLRESFVL